MDELELSGTVERRARLLGALELEQAEPAPHAGTWGTPKIVQEAPLDLCTTPSEPCTGLAPCTAWYPEPVTEGELN